MRSVHQSASAAREGLAADEQHPSDGRLEDGSGDRLPDGTHVGAVHLQIADLQRSVEYYTHALGLEVLERADGRALMGVASTGRVVAELTEKRGISPAPSAGRFGLFHFAILVPDRAALGRFAARVVGGNLLTGMADHAVSEALYLTDPDGLGIEVYADRPRHTWRYRGDELYMTTEPLDLGDVIAAGEGRYWERAPAGTVIGHVHLHVGNLAEAERFYHAALGLDKTVWSYPGALFLSAGGYHHHLGTNIWSPGPSPTDDEAQLLGWELVIPTSDDAEAASHRVTAAGYAATRDTTGWHIADPWGTRLRIVQEQEA
jgi:catechol 2,3-dioxygenase